MSFFQRFHLFQCVSKLSKSFDLNIRTSFDLNLQVYPINFTLKSWIWQRWADQTLVDFYLEKQLLHFWSSEIYKFIHYLLFILREKLIEIQVKFLQGWDLCEISHQILQTISWELLAAIIYKSPMHPFNSKLLVEFQVNSFQQRHLWNHLE